MGERTEQASFQLASETKDWKSTKHLTSYKTFLLLKQNRKHI